MAEIEGLECEISTPIALWKLTQKPRGIARISVAQRKVELECVRVGLCADQRSGFTSERRLCHSVKVQYGFSSSGALESDQTELVVSGRVEERCKCVTVYTILSDTNSISRSSSEGFIVVNSLIYVVALKRIEVILVYTTCFKSIRTHLSVLSSPMQKGSRCFIFNFIYFFWKYEEWKRSTKNNFPERNAQVGFRNLELGNIIKNDV